MTMALLWLVGATALVAGAALNGWMARAGLYGHKYLLGELAVFFIAWPFLTLYGLYVLAGDVWNERHGR